MMNEQYRETILDHFEQPRHRGELAAPTRAMTVTNPACGDLITVQLRTDPQRERIVALAWQGHGCTLSQAAASLVAEQCHGQRIETARHMDATMLADAFGEAAINARPRCATLALRALHAALSDDVLDNESMARKGDLEERRLQ
ncbi:MAG: iron-sulfur cluster assembly scaffold protein [Anaerolineales bacterium]|nr:iron-sulfur cluster assembly scaffold protein [Anaerolineales bacterium]MCB9172128.1 iron-sulfur cluster assembly scaffold protein [Ardenticatenales bacterium]